MAIFAPEPCALHAYRGTHATAIIVPATTLLFALTCDNANAGVRYIQFHNSRVALVSGVTALGNYPEFRMAGSGSVTVDGTLLGLAGFRFPDGLTFGYSTTSGIYTAGTAGECSLQVWHQ